MGRPRKQDIERTNEHERWLDEIVRLDEAAELRGISKRTLEREIKKGRFKTQKLSERRIGMTRREALRVIRVRLLRANCSLCGRELPEDMEPGC